MTDIQYLKSLQAVRDRAHQVLGAAQSGDLSHFDYHPTRMASTAEYVADIITRDYGPDRYDQIPPHGRWQHFDIGGVPRIDRLTKQWELDGCDKREIARRLVDLFFFSVLVDAGAGDVWRFTEPDTGHAIGRSEGIAVASLYMFTSGALSSQTGGGADILGHALAALDSSVFQTHFQIDSNNPMVGDQSRVNLLNNIGQSLLRMPKVFGPDGRPGQLVDYMLSQKKESESLDFTTLWTTLQDLLLPAWPKDRTHIAGTPLGDAWPLQTLARLNANEDTPNNTQHIQPFHKLTQWLAYSLTVPFVRVLDLHWANDDQGTGLPEYRNGGLFIDLGVLTLKDEDLRRGREASGQDIPAFGASSDVIVEWRAMTVALLDELHKLVAERLAQKGVRLSLAQMLEAGSWKGGREQAAKLRPETRSGPFIIQGDGTLF
ncbi:DUF1688-domain-containing protein [Aspergillus campestris IBT 28561]|uniref:DUF1688-domain-containing protein n=1 Tax=Aspergillus campestris (strain IBT 28561) TaxID=1392248 RepID=A0A2I1DE12_ASPC2|nr:DUF1688-domain-containing protein [Aspergillus campestris IBT 28561]PKY08118.1 DUF1688-domain-containing protein [Aspergillus campestris IBT 28561]